MVSKNGWLKARRRRLKIIAWSKKILGGSIISALIVGPLIYFGVAAQETAQVPEGNLRNAALEQAEATPEITTSQTPIKFPEKVEVKKPGKVEDLGIEVKDAKLPKALTVQEEVTPSIATELTEENLQEIAASFQEQPGDIKIKNLENQSDGQTEKSLVLNDVTIDYGPSEIKNDNDANAAARIALKKYLDTVEGGDQIAIIKDTTKLDQVNVPDAMVLSQIRNHNSKWYADFQQYHNKLPVFDGNAKLIFTEKKNLLVLTDNIRRNLPALEEFKVGTAVANESTKALFEWDETKDKIEYVNKGYYKEKPAYKVETDAHNPLGKWDVYVNGVDGTVEGLMSDISTQDELPEEEPLPEVIPEEPTEETLPIEEPIITEEPATPESEVTATEEPEIEILQTLLSQVFGKIYPKTPADAQETQPLANEYVYINQTQFTTDDQGYFDNPDQKWYSLFLEGPYVTVRDDHATSNAETIDKTPEDPFTWDENSASLAAINAFYHTNKIHDWFAENMEYEMNVPIPLTVNSQLIDDYMGGCGAWFDNSQKTIEIGRGGEGFTDGFSSCADDLNYALSSDILYHEYTHYIVEDVTHLPNINGAESAAMGEGLADYFANTINDDSVFGDVVSPNNTRDLNNTLNYTTGMTGESHHDGQIFAGALWDLRTAIGAEAVDKLIFNTLYQGRLHFETFMYGMIIEDDDDGDFSNGTPHLIAIIQAFENHGIGPGVQNFNGLPITPEEWTKILEEQTPEGEEEPLMGTWRNDGGTGCTWSALEGSNLTVNAGATCTLTGAGTALYVYVYGTLNIGDATTGGQLTLTRNVVVYTGGILNTVYSTTGNSTITATTTGYGYVSVGQATATGTLNIIGKGTSQSNFLSVINGATININSTGTYTVIGHTNVTEYASVDGTLNVYGTLNTAFIDAGTTSNEGGILYVRSGGKLNVTNSGTAAFELRTDPAVYNYGTIAVTGTIVFVSGYSSQRFYNGISGGVSAGTVTAADLSLTGSSNGIFYNYKPTSLTSTVNISGTTTVASGNTLNNYNQLYSAGINLQNGGSITTNDYLEVVGGAFTTASGSTFTMSAGSILFDTTSTSLGGTVNLNAGYLDDYNGITITGSVTLANATVVLHTDGAIAINGGTLTNANNANSRITVSASLSLNGGTLTANGPITTSSTKLEVLNAGTANFNYTGTTAFTSIEVQAPTSGNTTLAFAAGSLFTTSTTYACGTDYCSVEIGTEGDSGTATFTYNNNLTVGNTRLIKVGSRGTFDENGDLTLNGGNFKNGGTTDVSGTTQINATSTLDNSSSYTTYILAVGYIATDTQGGTLNNLSGGDFNVTYTSSAAAQVYKNGNIVNNSGATDFDIDGQFLIQGNSAASGTFNTSAPAHIKDIRVSQYGLMDINAGTVTCENSLDVFEVSGSAGVVDVASGANLTITNTINMGNTTPTSGGNIINAGTINGNSLNMYDLANITNDNTFNVTTVVSMDDDSDITSSVLFDVGSSFTMTNDDVTGNPPTVVVESGDFNIDTDLNIYFASTFENNGNMDVLGSLTLGIGTGGNTSQQTAAFNNEPGAVINISTNLNMYRNTDFYNTAGTVDVDSAGNGLIQLLGYDSATASRPQITTSSSGTVSTFTLWLGDDVVDYGGIFTVDGNETGNPGVLNLTYSAGAALYIYDGGQLINKGDFNNAGGIYSLGNAVSTSYIQNVNSGLYEDFDVAGIIYLEQYSQIDNAGNFDANNATTSLTTPGINNITINSTGGDMTLNSAVTIAQNTNVNFSNSATLTVNGNFVLDGTADMVMDGLSSIDVNGTFTNDANFTNNGTFECDTTLTLSSNGFIFSDNTSVFTITGSDTTIDGDYELDGTLNTGNLTVNSGGNLHPGNGVSTNFYVNATGNLAINSNGYISATGRSTLNRNEVLTHAGGGSNGGQGVDSDGSPSPTLNYAAFTMPYYGEQGEFAGGTRSAYGGGGLYLEIDGNITIDGSIEAGGEGLATCNTNNGGAGAGGSIYINHSPASSSATFSGTGSITANGGNGSSGTYNCYPGGGGRIRITSPLLDHPDDDGTAAPHYQFPMSMIQARGGSGNGQAAAGTIYLDGDENNWYGSFLVDQNYTAPTGNAKTVISGTAVESTFGRIEAKNNARVDFPTDPSAAPFACYQLNSGTVTYSAGGSPYLCSDYDHIPDKPDTLYINDSWGGAQSGYEPFVGETSVSDIYDLTPNFSLIVRNPQLTSQTYSSVEIEVRDAGVDTIPYTPDDNILWQDAGFGNNPVTLTTAVIDGERTEDIIYGGNALSTDVTYYIRARFYYDATHPGLWTHRDIGDHYNFEIEGTFTIDNLCSDLIEIKDGVNNIIKQDGNRYGSDSCDIEYSTVSGADYQILYGMAPGETNFDDGINYLTPINNDTGTCIMDPSGNTNREEYAFNISNVLGTPTPDVQTDTENCSGSGACVTAGKDYNDNADCYFDIEASGSEDTIILPGFAMSGDHIGEFTLNVYVNASDSTVASTYDLDTNVIITTPP